MNNKKQTALNALLESTTLTEAAQKAGVSRKTIYSYLVDDHEFAKQYQSAQRLMTLQQLDDMRSRQQKAHETIVELMEGGDIPPNIRLKAAQTIINEAMALTSAAGAAVQSIKSDNDPLSLDLD